jgi:gpW
MSHLHGNHYVTMTSEERDRYEGWLREAEEALHDLRTGKQARVFVDQNGERMEFLPSNSERLRAYIMELRMALGKPCGIQGPLRFRL